MWHEIAHYLGILIMVYASWKIVLSACNTIAIDSGAYDEVFNKGLAMDDPGWLRWAFGLYSTRPLSEPAYSLVNLYAGINAIVLFIVGYALVRNFP